MRLVTNASVFLTIGNEEADELPIVNVIGPQELMRVSDLKATMKQHNLN